MFYLCPVFLLQERRIGIFCNMAYIISIETATEVCSVALSENDNCVCIKEINEVNNHSKALLPFVDEMLAQSGVSLANIDAVAISEGPGSYTGLRIGVSTAKGLCFALNKPLIAVSTLQSIAYGAMMLNGGNDCLFCPMIDARRMEVYCAIYDKNFIGIQSVTNLIIDEHSFNDYLLQKPIVFCGNAVEKVKPVIAYQRNARFANVVCSAAYMAKLAYDKYVQQQFVDVAYFEPFYLKAFQSAVSKVKGLV